MVAKHRLKTIIIKVMRSTTTQTLGEERAEVFVAFNNRAHIVIIVRPSDRLNDSKTSCSIFIKDELSDVIETVRSAPGYILVDPIYKDETNKFTVCFLYNGNVENVERMLEENYRTIIT